MNMSASKHQNFNINSYVMLESSTNTTILIGGPFQNHCASANPFLRVFLYRYLTQAQYYQHSPHSYHGSINGDNKISIGFSSQLNFGRKMHPWPTSLITAASMDSWCTKSSCWLRSNWYYPGPGDQIGCEHLGWRWPHMITSEKPRSWRTWRRPSGIPRSGRGEKLLDVFGIRGSVVTVGGFLGGFKVGAYFRRRSPMFGWTQTWLLVSVFFFFVDRFVPIRVLTFLFDGIKLGEGKAIDSAFLQFFLGVAPIFWGVQNQKFEIGSCHSLKRF